MKIWGWFEHIIQVDKGCQERENNGLDKELKEDGRGWEEPHRVGMLFPVRLERSIGTLERGDRENVHDCTI